MMKNPTEKDELQYLESIKEKIVQTLSQIDETLQEQAKDLHASKEYLYENKDAMDRMEKEAVRYSITSSAIIGEASVEKRKRIEKLLDSPYFGRIDFSETGKKERKPVYIGIYSFYDEKEKSNIIHDWRAPISSMYYDFELGKAFYQAPSGKIKGEVLLKRQYRIRKGKMEFMLENSLNIHDDILQEELSKASDDKMKNIVATIQRDQNAIIRNETSRVLIIQGVAGSGKTSIALHRIAFLLYRFRENLSSKEILIISPNKVFADYISNVLPELGEERIPEMGMEELAHKVLDNKYKLQTFAEQVNSLLERPDEAFINRIRFKASFSFQSKLDEYVNHVNNNFFEPTDIWIKKNFVPQWFIRERWEGYHRLPLMKRFNEITRDIEENIRIFYKYEIETQERNEIRKTVSGMFRTTNIRELYREFFNWLGKPDLFKTASRSVLEYADVFPLIYLKIRLEGFKAFEDVKHLLVDEMQDYTPVQYAVLSRLFPCKKTILGDAAQSVNPFSSSSAEEIRRVFPEADTVKLLKSYRSTYEISRFAQKISPSKEFVAIERHGEKPLVKVFKSVSEEHTQIEAWVEDFRKSGEHQSLGIICKTPKQADNLYTALSEKGIPTALITSESAAFSQGVVITTVHMSKGLEFDRVIVPQASASNYNSVTDKSMLYIACTRAMHRLFVSGAGKLTGFLQ
ncbi:MAG: helicase [Bacteroidetes bacterium]|nr:MAG: helicase [Bacteroidota bacterium]